jgi:hypothetical protein
MSCLPDRSVWQGPIALLVAASISILSAGCQSKSSASSSGLSAPLSGHSGAAEDSKKVTDGIKLLMDSLDKPQAPFHFSYQANENMNPKFPMTDGELPKLGPVTVEADLSADQVSVTENRAGKQTETKATKSDMSFGLAKLGVMGCMLEVTFPLAYAGPTAEAAGSDAVGGVPADKFNMDTTTANASTQAALAMLGGMLNGKIKVKSVKGSAWLEKSTGRLVKFDLNTDLSTQDGHTWQEHYAAVLTPK